MTEEANAETKEPEKNENQTPDTTSKTDDNKAPEGTKEPEDKNNNETSAEEKEPEEAKKDQTQETSEEIKAIQYREVDKPYQSKIEEMLEKHNVPVKDRADLYEAFSTLQEEISQEYEAKSKKDLAEWEQEQGSDLAKNKELAQRGSAALGFSEDEMAVIERVIGTKALMTKCLNIGSAISEDTAKGLGGSGSTRSQEMSTEAYLEEILNKGKDK